MTHRLRRIAGAAAVASALAVGAGAPSMAHADSVPQILAVSPRTLTLGAGPLTVTLTGHGLGTVNAVNLSPAVAHVSFAVYNDSTILLSLPPTIAPGTYVISASTPFAGTDPLSQPTLLVLAAASQSVADAPPPRPAYSFAPAPAAVDAPTPESALATPAASPTSTSGKRPVAVPAQPGVNPVWPLAAGVALGVLAYLLWGGAGRLGVARRQDFLAQLVARPVQRLHLGRICLHCGRLHTVWSTRRDLWRAGQYCSATCFVAAQEEEHTVATGDGVAHGRLREVVVYSELDKALEAAFSGEARVVQEAGILFGDETRAVVEAMRGGDDGTLGGGSSPVEASPVGV